MFDKILDRQATKSLKWDRTILKERFGDPDILPLWVADMDFEAAPAIKAAILKEVQINTYGYSLPGQAYYQAIINWYKERFNWSIKKDWILITPGIVTGLGFILDAYLQAGDQVLIQEPVYYPFRMMIENHGLSVANNPLIREQGTYRMDFEDMEAKLKEDKTKMFILCSPHNPIGQVWSQEDLRKIVDLCKQYQVLILADEIHHDLVYGGNHQVLANLCPDYKTGIITATAPSKTFNLAGMQMSHMIIEDKDLRAQLENQLERIHLAPPNPLAIAGVQGAYEGGQAWLEDLLVYLKANIDTIEDFLANHLPKAGFVPPQGTYLAWIDLSAYEKDDQALQERLVKKGRVALNPGIMFGQGGSGHVRLNFACPRTTLIQALESIRKAVAQ